MRLNLPQLIGFGTTFAPIILSTFCSLTHFVRSLLSLTLFAPSLQTHFVHSLHFRSLTSFVRSWRSLRLLLACSLTSSIRFAFAHSLRSFALGTRFARALPPYDLVFRFALYNLSGGGCPLKSPTACTITFYNSLIPLLCPYCRKKAPILVHLDCPIACTITFFNSLVQSLCSKKFFPYNCKAPCPILLNAACRALVSFFFGQI